jgi:hypothetical protein
MRIGAAVQLAVEHHGVDHEPGLRRVGRDRQRGAQQLPAEEGIVVAQPRLALAEVHQVASDGDDHLRAVDLLERDPGSPGRRGARVFAGSGDLRESSVLHGGSVAVAAVRS